MNIPRDVLYGDILIRLYGNKEAIIENYKSILLYTDEEVVIACKKMNLRIYGNKLRIAYFSCNDMKVTGCIQAITYLLNGDL